ncbi:MAG: ATP-dependent Clp protease ATP-binding subunit ClpX [Lachnospiraceae bacterium]|nr:ATP-dependent Clp protease ATP-binding subunit ClpX [Lachnospiraceae bacterium]MBR4412677.1 ATP-dependent Clp protease ATP-binding subunit ClpX [Lachnospiraceae bacterium]MBR5066450.1 ATP-dependent Clp protease ATP-binding subunit ClpX [Lachnospiraceae bacterium]MBR5916978.1 ATP-dependent Clp protease ATP-binding subunit ClpX [Lachnospiraceae bacterium]
MSNDYEDICSVCHRTESVAGKMLKMSDSLCICMDCLQKSTDMLNQSPYKEMLGMDPAAMAGMFPGMNLNNPTEAPAGIQENKTEDITKISGEDEPEKKEEKKDDKPKGPSQPHGTFFLNLNDLMGGNINPRTKIKKRNPDEKKEPIIKLKDIPAPHKLKAKLDEYVIGQEEAKKILSVAVYNHYKRVATDTMDEIEIEKSNILMLGPTGCGKTYIVKTLAKLLDVPLAIADATALTEAGYIGDDIESVVSKLLAAADNDVDKAECGIIFVDEIDKLAKKPNTNHRDVSGESVQQGMLKLLEGAEIEVPVGATSKNAMVPMTTVNTRNILFICGGAFPDLEEIIKARLTKQAGIGFNSELKDKYDKDKKLLHKVTTDDIKKYGMIPEFVGRLPIICPLDSLDEDALVDILKEPKNAILKQYQKLLELDEVKLIFDDSALRAIAKKAIKKDTGARALRAIIEEFMLDIMYEIPKDENIGTVTITGDYIEGKGGPIVEMRV